MFALLGVFITERYRLVAVPGLLIFAALGSSILRKAFAAREFKNAAIYLALLTLATIFVAWPQRDRSLWALDAYNSGWQALESNNLSLAEKKLAVAYAYVPENPETLFALGNLRFTQNDPSAAQSFYRSVLNLDLHHKGAFNNLGVIALDAKKYPEAEKWFRHAEDVDPRNAKTHFLLAKTLLAKNDSGAARAEIDTAIRLKPNQTEFKELKKQIEENSR
jgi:tetratricopeptide (TPR) repeat protein